MVPTVSVITVRAACAFFPRPRPLDDTGLVVIGGGGTGGGVSSLFTGGSLTAGGGDGEGGGGGVGSLGGGDGDNACGGGDGDGARGGGDGDGKFSSSSEFEGLLDNGVEFFVLGLTRLEKENKKKLTQKACRHMSYACKRHSLNRHSLRNIHCKHAKEIYSTNPRKRNVK